MENCKAEFQSAAGLWNFREGCTKVKGTLNRQRSSMISPGSASQYLLRILQSRSCCKTEICSVQHCPYSFHLQPKQKLGEVSHLLVCDCTYSLGQCSCLFSCVGMCVVVLVAVFCVLLATGVPEAIDQETPCWISSWECHLLPPVAAAVPRLTRSLGAGVQPLGLLAHCLPVCG